MLLKAIRDFVTWFRKQIGFFRLLHWLKALISPKLKPEREHRTLEEREGEMGGRKPSC
jgi:hypothetical protein